MRWAALYRPAQFFVVYLLHTTVRITPQTKRRNIVVDGIGGEVLSEALEALAFGRKPHTLGYSGSRRRPSTSQVSSCHKPASGVSTCSVNRGRPLPTLGTQLSLYFTPARSSRSWQSLSRWPRPQMLCVILLKAALSGGSSSQSDRGRKGSNESTGSFRALRRGRMP